MQTLPAEPSRRPGSLAETPASRLACPLCGRLPSCQRLQWHQGERSPGFLPRSQGSSSRARGLFLRVWCKGHPPRLQRESGSVRPGLQQRRQRWPGTRRRWRRQPASWGDGRRREEVKAGLLRAWRSGGRHCGDPAPRRGRRTHPSWGCPGRARAAAGRELRPPRFWLAAASLPRSSLPGLHGSSPAPRAATAAASSASARRAPRTEPQHCLPLNSLHATWPSSSLSGSWAEPVPGLLQSWGKGPCFRASAYSPGKWA